LTSGANVPPLGTLADALAADPRALYPALAALLLAAVSLASGLLRGDVLSLTKPRPVAIVLLAVLASWALRWGLGHVATDGWEPSAVVTLAPLTLVALGYGPTPALVALALSVAWFGHPDPSGATGAAIGGWLLGLELLVLGWLAIAPSPRRWPLLAGLYLVLAHALAWSTAGLAWMVIDAGEPTLAALREWHGHRLLELAAVATALAALPPRFWRAAFPDSSLAVPTGPPASAATQVASRPADPAAVSTATEPELDRDLAPWSRRNPRRHVPLPAPGDAPAPYLRRQRRQRPDRGPHDPGR
jgi:hypothetical protein